MRTREFNKLTVGQRVIVTGKQDGNSFRNASGVILPPTRGLDVVVKFDDLKDGWGDNGALDCWGFERSNVRHFNITPEPVKAEIPKAAPLPKKRPHGKQEYKGNGKHAWETVVENTVRLRVPGGWLYGKRIDRVGVLADTTFVPVPQAVGYAV